MMLHMIALAAAAASGSRELAADTPASVRHGEQSLVVAHHPCRQIAATEEAAAYLDCHTPHWSEKTTEEKHGMYDIGSYVRLEPPQSHADRFNVICPIIFCVNFGMVSFFVLLALCTSKTKSD